MNCQLVKILSIFEIFKPGAHGPKAMHAWFFEIVLVRVSVCARACVCVCVSAPEVINNQWRDKGCVRLVKQVLRLFPTFNYFIRHLPSIKWMGVAILTEHVVNTCQRKLR